MLNMVRLGTAMVLVSLLTSPASAQAQRPQSQPLLTGPAFAQARHPRILQQGDDKKMVKQPMSDIDKRMVRDCKAMPFTKMTSDPECQLYLKNHPDWMKEK